jgi:hypothetical protein
MLKKHSLSKTVLTSHSSKKLFQWSQNFANSCSSALNFKSFFLITVTIFSQSRSEQFWKQNIIKNSDISFNIFNTILCKLYIDFITENVNIMFDFCSTYVLHNFCYSDKNSWVTMHYCKCSAYCWVTHTHVYNFLPSPFCKVRSRKRWVLMRSAWKA